MAVNKEINKNLQNLMNSTENISNIDTLQSKKYLEIKEIDKINIVNNKLDNSSLVFSVRIKKKDVELLKRALKKQGVNNFSSGLKQIIYKYMLDNGIIR